MMKNIKVDNHQFISRLIYANNALFLQKWDAPIWKDKGDTGKLLDAEGKEVSSFSYGN